MRLTSLCNLNIIHLSIKNEPRPLNTSLLVTRWKTDPEKHRRAASSAYRCWTLICFFMSGYWMRYDTSTFCTEVWIIHTRTHADGSQSRQPGPAVIGGSISGPDWIAEPCELQTLWEPRTTQIGDNAPMEEFAVVTLHIILWHGSNNRIRSLRRGKATRKRHETRDRRWAEGGRAGRGEFRSTGWSSCCSGPAGTDCETNTLRTATEGGEERGSRETEEAISGWGWRLSTT